MLNVDGHASGRRRPYWTGLETTISSGHTHSSDDVKRPYPRVRYTGELATPIRTQDYENDNALIDVIDNKLKTLASRIGSIQKIPTQAGNSQSSSRTITFPACGYLGLEECAARPLGWLAGASGCAGRSMTSGNGTTAPSLKRLHSCVPTRVSLGASIHRERWKCATATRAGAIARPHREIA